MSKNLRVLAVISDQRLLAKIDNLLRRRTLEVNHASSGAGALVLAGNLRYDLVIAEQPLADLQLADLLAAMRALDSMSAQSNFLVLNREDSKLPPLDTRHDDNLRFLPAGAEVVDLHDAVTSLLGVAARRSARLLVEVEVRLEQGSSRFLYQSQNLSESGILMRGGRGLALGSKVGFELALPGGPVAGEALVVRHTSPAEAVAGCALRFLGLSPDQVERIRTFVYAGLAGRDEPVRAAGGDR